MALVTTDGLILRETDYGESDKILTVLTPSLGKITVFAKHSRSMKNPYVQISRPLCYNDLVLNQKGDYYWLKEASQMENFYPPNADLLIHSLEQYFLEVACEVCVEGQDESEMLRLVLNSLYMLIKNSHPAEFVKAVFELRTACCQGFMPDLTECAVCHNDSSDLLYLDVMNGIVKCKACFSKEAKEAEGYGSYDLERDGTARIILPLSHPVAEAMRYVTLASPKRIFSFDLDEEALPDFGSVCEKYLLNHIDRSFVTLDFYKDVKELFHGNQRKSPQDS